MSETAYAAALAPMTAAAADMPDPVTATQSWFGMIVPSPIAAAIPEPLRALFDAGGPVMLILAAMSVFALTIVLIKLWQFARLRNGGAESVEPALRDWRAGRRHEAVERLAQARNPLAEVVRSAMLGSLHPNDPAALREEIERRAAHLLTALRSHLRGLEVIASLGPLLGLLGTVIGMIDAFRALEAAGNQVDPSVLSGGIWVALLTTAAGLAVAIPTVVALNWLERLLEGVTRRLEDQVTRVFTGGLRLEEPVVAPPRPLATPRIPDAL
ncbi:MotA/TolQ/ExbB proton channel family protein [Thiocapsa rosea]|uniref:Outer membrane transport energization protein ExbB n=1 Tax=Thiocapsa rosea TaxID=69360 RepID=A0A495VH03_9GAMM|nr:MotA/TolQ/ExbB proton channel family protein [Thiocapsa rosea]RKT47148.1 outer membrane transport energization protein ExbB [Thiocapsa rosea]